MTTTKATPWEVFVLVLSENYFLQYAMIVPLVTILVWIFGFYSGIGSLIVVSIGYSVRTVAAKKARHYGTVTKIKPIRRNKREIQHCGWLNLLIRRYWITCVPTWVQPQIERVNNILQEKKPKFMKKLDIERWKLGELAPRITQIYTPIETSGSRFELQFEVLFIPNAELVVNVQPHEKLLFQLHGAEFKFKAMMKLTFLFDDIFPECSVVGIEFIDNPFIELSVRPVEFLDLLSIPLVYEFVQEITKANLAPLMISPNRIQFSLGGGKIETEDSMDQPITNIVLIYSDTSKAPPGYYLLQRTASGMLAANLNKGNSGKKLFICYSREEGQEPITGICILYPQFDVRPPPGFEVILETPAAEPASINIGNTGTEGFICISRAPGQPITGLTITNESEDYILPEGFRILELSPTSHKANLNKRAGGDRLYIAYKGGYKSYYGFPKEIKNPERGALRIELVEARNLVAADLGGTSDPFADLIITRNPTEKRAESETKSSRVIEKTLTPHWKEVFIFRNVSRSSILTINVYDKDKIEITPEFLGRTVLPLDKLVAGKHVDQWIPLQLIEKGKIHIRVTALDFGLPEDQEVTPFLPHVCVDSGGFISGLGEIGLKGIIGVGKGVKGVKDVAEGVGGKALDGVTGVGGKALDGFTGVGGKALRKFSSFSEGESKENPQKVLERARSKKISKKEHLEQAITPATVPVKKEGLLERLSSHMIKKLVNHKRYAILQVDSLLLFRRKKDSLHGSPAETYILGELKCVSTSERHSNCFDLVDKKGSHLATFKCETLKEMKTWIAAIQGNINCLQ